MKVLGVIGSPRKKGNTAVLVQKALNAVREEWIETEAIFLKDYKIKDCQRCDKCADSLKCSINDDMQKLYPKILEADGIIMGSPTYYYNITGYMQAFINRLYCFLSIPKEDRSCYVGINEALGFKFAVIIGVCEQPEESFMGFTCHVMKKSVIDLGYRPIQTVLATHLDKVGDALKDEKILMEAEKAGKKLATVLYHNKYGKELLQKEYGLSPFQVDYSNKRKEQN